MLKRRLGTSSFNGVFLKICKYNPTSKIQKLEIGPEKIFMQRQIFCKIGKCDILPIYICVKIAQNLSYRFFKIFGCGHNSPLKINCENFIMDCMVGF